MGVLYAIKRQQERRRDALQRGEQFILAPGRERCDVRRHALVHYVPQQPLEGVGVEPLDRPLLAPREFFDGAYPWIVATLGEAHGAYALRMPLEHDAHRVQAEDRFQARG